ncbi:MAG: competence/damage-inducible protein A [Alphaproteobacteria bacterium]|nr:competence/damage-inducible protein A [Alphaproteobacteria bacterium]
MAQTVTAAVLLIGDELLSGRTQDSNLKTIAEFLAPLGVEVREARVVPDVKETIVETVNHLRKAWDYVFTTGGIGPTHDDITADAIAAAFGRSIDVRADAVEVLTAHYAARFAGEKGMSAELNESRLRMARIPDGADLILNPVSGAPGFCLENVFVMAGVPSIMRGMLQDVGHRVRGGDRVHAATVRGRGMREGDIAGALRKIAEATPDVSLGSYPFMKVLAEGTEFGVNLVARGRDPARVASAVDALVELLVQQGATPEINPKD